MSITLEQARNAKQKILRAAKDNSSLRDALAGVGITSTHLGYGLKINLSRPITDESLLPASIDGVPIQVEVVGNIEKLD